MTPNLPDKLRRLADWFDAEQASTRRAWSPSTEVQDDLREAADTLEAQAREIAQTERIAEEMRSIVQAQEKKLAWLRESCKTLIEFYDGAAKCDECDEQEMLCEEHMAMEKKAVELAKAALTSTLAEKPE